MLFDLHYWQQRIAMTFDDLLDMSASQWNGAIAEHLGVTIEALRDNMSMRQNLPMTEDKIRMVSRSAPVAKVTADPELPGQSSKDEGFGPQEIDGAAIHGKIIPNIDLSGSNLVALYFNGSVVFNSLVIGARIVESVFSNTTFNMVDFTRAHFEDVTFYRCRFVDVVMDNCSFRNCKFVDTTMISCQLTSANIDASSFIGHGMSECTMYSASLRGCDLSMTTFVGCDLGDASMCSNQNTDVSYINVRMIGVDLIHSTYNGVTANNVEYDGPFTELFTNDMQSGTPAFIDELLDSAGEMPADDDKEYDPTADGSDDDDDDDEDGEAFP